MGYYIQNIRLSPEEDELTVNEYIGSNTINSIAVTGAFDLPVSDELQDLASRQENIIAIVDANGVEHFLNSIKNNNPSGRDVQKLIELVEEKLQDGFMII
jgi:hypothetical protein